MQATTGLPVFLRKVSRSWYMMSLAVTAPPGLLMRSTTALTSRIVGRGVEPFAE